MFLQASQGQGFCTSNQGPWTRQVLWSVLDEAGMLRTLKVPALYILDAKIKLLSVNSLRDVFPEETVTFYPQQAIMSGVPGDPNQRQINITRNPTNNLPTSYTYKYQGTYQASHHLANSVSTIHHSNLNLSPAQKELLQWHNRLGHMGFKKIQFLIRTGKVLIPLHASLLPTPLCCMSVWQTETKAVSRQEKLSGQGC